MYSIETKDLSYRFSAGEQVLDRLCLQVPEGSIYGFLGPNGAGKTTTLRLLLGLLRGQQGEVLLLGKQLSRHRLDLLRKVGTLIEYPSLYGHLTAMENLRVWQRIYRCPEANMARVLQWTGLQYTGTKSVGRFSLGMKQRLGIAISLLHDPSLLLLDEPVNGLDPNGMIEIRELLQQLNREQGMTILVSSHLLAEMARTATHTGVISKGRLVFQGSLQQLQQQAEATAYFITGDPQRTEALMRQEGLLPVTEGNQLLIPSVSPGQMARLNSLLTANDIPVYQSGNRQADLESVFINLINTTS